jgi:transcription-repair coupling factor (superfamily II helicase)
LNGIREEVKDRYGPLPNSVENLFKYGTARALARGLRIETIDRMGSKLVFKFRPDSRVDVSGLTRLLDRRRGHITPQGVLSLRLSAHGEGSVLDETICILKELSHI